MWVYSMEGKKSDGLTQAEQETVAAETGLPLLKASLSSQKLLLGQIASGAHVIIRVSGEPLVTLP